MKERVVREQFGLKKSAEQMSIIKEEVTGSLSVTDELVEKINKGFVKNNSLICEILTIRLSLITFGLFTVQGLCELWSLNYSYNMFLVG